MANPLKKQHNLGFIQFAALTIICAMAVTDYMSMFWLFREMVSPTESGVYALSLALGLEGAPFFLGMIHSQKHDNANYLTSDKKVLQIGFWMSMLAFAVVYVVTIVARLQWIAQLKQNLRPDRFEEESLAQYILMFLPLATSLMAYIASWFAFRSSAVERQYKVVIKKQDIFTQCQENFQNSFDAYQQAKRSLWTSLEDREGVPLGSKAFRDGCYNRIRAKLVSNCLTCYPTQIERYTQRVNEMLEKCILEMAEHSTLPQSISCITLAEVIAEHDARAMDYADCWDYNYAGPDLEAELRSTLDNAVVVAQFETILRSNNTD